MAIVDPITVRIPELPAQVLPSLTDKMPLWAAEDNKTRHVSLQTLRELILSGGSGSLPPVYKGGSIVYVVPLSTPTGVKTASFPSLAGKNFILRREGRPMIPQTVPATPGAEYEVLNAGGFKLLLEDDMLMPGERYELDVFELQGTAPGPSPSPGAGSLITGVVQITTNLTLNPTDHLNKLLQLRAGSGQVTVTLFDVEDIPANTIVCIEATITNTFQNKAQTQGGQYIYYRNQSKNYIYIGSGETLWLYRGDDGYYVLNDLSSIYDPIGKPQGAYKVGLNEILANGSLLSRAQHPRLWEEVQTFGSSLVSDAVWNTASVTVAGRAVERPYRGCWSTGDGSTTFRAPDLMNMSLRGLKSGADDQRHANTAGIYQRHEYESHTHAVKPPDSNSDSGSGKTATGGDSPEGSGIAQYNTNSSGGIETRMDNIGILWVIKE